MKLYGLFASFIVAAGISAAAWADCTSPSAGAGIVIYAQSQNTMVFCDGTSWISMSGGANVTVGGNTNNPGGADTQVQFNSGGTAFGGSAGLTWNTGTSTLTATNVAATAITATTVGGVLTTAAQVNVTSLGALTGLVVNGVATVATVTATNVYAGNVSTTTLYVNGVAVTGNAQGDRITSGTTVSSQMVMNGGSTYVSLSTGATTWGYLSSATSWLPVVGANTISSMQVSATNISLTTGRFLPTNVVSVAGGGGNYIVSATTQVSVSSVGTIKFASTGALAMTISGSNVGIGTPAPTAKLEIGGVSSLGLLKLDSGDTSSGSNNNVQIAFGFGGGNQYSHYITTWHNSAAANNAINFYTSDGTANGVYPTNAVLGLSINNGKVGVGTTNPGGSLEVKNASNASIIINGHTGTGNMAQLIFQDAGIAKYSWNYAANGCLGLGDASGVGMYICQGGTAWTANSDRRIKRNIHSLTHEQGLGAIEKLNPITFNWSEPGASGRTQVGVIAQDVEKVLPQIVTRGAPTSRTPDGTLGVEYTGLIAPLIKAVQELKADNDNLRSEARLRDTAIEALHREVEALKAARH